MEIFCVHELEGLILVKYLLPPKWIPRFNAILIKISTGFFTELNKVKFIWNHERSHRFSNLEKEQQIWRHCTPNITKETTETLWHWHKNKHVQINGQNRESRNKPVRLRINYNKSAKTIQQGKDSLFNKWFCENGIATFKRMKLDHYLIPYAKIILKWIKDLNVRLKTIRMLKKTQAVSSVTFILAMFQIQH